MLLAIVGFTKQATPFRNWSSLVTNSSRYVKASGGHYKFYADLPPKRLS
jgi:hypothetical protein